MNILKTVSAVLDDCSIKNKLNKSLLLNKNLLAMLVFNIHRAQV